MKIKEVLSNKRFLVIILLSVLFIGLAVYTYKTYINPKNGYVANKEFKKEGNANANDNADLYFFYTEWCPHCKKAKPQWKQLKEDVGTNKINGKRVNFIEVDCDKDPATAEKYKVEGYPTIKLLIGNEVIEYDAKPEFSTLKQFLNVSL